MIQRLLAEKVTSLLGGKKAIVIIGARQVGKSTLLHSMLQDRKDVLWLNGDEQDVRELFRNISSTRLRAIIGDHKLVVVDEAQRIEQIGLRLKLITDQMEGIQVIATGSSSFQLASKVSESLTGRKREFKMFPLSFAELMAHTSLLEELRMLPHRLVFGCYPEVICSPGSEKIVLSELSDSYLYKDILALDRVHRPDKLSRLLKALALQIGSQVSYNEIGNLIGIDAKTVERYIDLLEKSYVVFRLGSFSRNLRNELKTSRKVYFWDLGIRNAVIGNFAQLENRTDVGMLWENYVIAERLKRNAYRDSFAGSWFWRTQQQKEIDYMEEEDGQMCAFEFKWNAHKANVKCPQAFQTAYPQASFQVITPQNVETFLL